MLMSVRVGYEASVSDTAVGASTCDMVGALGAVIPGTQAPSVRAKVVKAEMRAAVIMVWFSRVPSRALALGSFI